MTVVNIVCNKRNIFNKNSYLQNIFKHFLIELKRKKL